MRFVVNVRRMPITLEAQGKVDAVFTLAVVSLVIGHL